MLSGLLHRKRSMRVFISYRREDSAGQAGRLADGLVSRLGAENVYVDVDSIGPGQDFLQHIKGALLSCDVVLAVIGRTWQNSWGRSGRRLDDPEDFVRFEIETALKLGLPVVPVLVQGALMPRPEDLPEPLRPLALRNAVELADNRWGHDVDAFVKALRRLPISHDVIALPDSPSYASVPLRVSARSEPESVSLLPVENDEGFRPMVGTPTAIAGSAAPFLQGSRSRLVMGAVGLAAAVSITVAAWPSDGAEPVAQNLRFSHGLVADAMWPASGGACTRTPSAAAYVLTVKPTISFCEANPRGDDLISMGNVRVAVDVTWSDAVLNSSDASVPAIALTCQRRGGSTSVESGYRATLGADGSYDVVRIQSGESIDLNPVSVHRVDPAIAGKPRHIELICTGHAGGTARLQLFVGGQRVAIATDKSGLPAGSVSIAVPSIPSRTVSAEFSNLWVSHATRSTR